MRALPGVVGLGAFGVAFGLAAWGMRSPELEEILGTVRRRLARRAAG